MNPVNRRLLIALALSAALNVFLAGFVAARLAYGGRGGPERGAPAFAPRDRLSSDEKPARVGPMKRFFRGRERQLAPQRQALRKARKAVARALDADPFQPESLRAALAELRKATIDSQQALHDALVDTAMKSTPEQRRELSRSRFLRRAAGQRPRRTDR
jgi:uncharacterized membrane protein